MLSTRFHLLKYETMSLLSLCSSSQAAVHWQGGEDNKANTNVATLTDDWADWAGLGWADWAGELFLL